jgi:hypothetical protein
LNLDIDRVPFPEPSLQLVNGIVGVSVKDVEVAHTLLDKEGPGHIAVKPVIE